MVAVVAAVAVGLMFVVAGAAKLALGRAWPAQARALGVPGHVAAVVPWVELALGAALVVQLARPWPAVAAVALLLAFTGLIVRHLLAGRRPECACFGAWSSRPIGASHLVRNGVFLALAMVAIAA